MAVAGNELRSDPLSPYSRSQHRNLLIAASVGFLFVILDPDRISALGVDIESSKRGWILVILVATVVYFEFAFYAASRADYHVWRQSLSAQQDHLNALLDDSGFTNADAQLDQNLADGERPEEIARRRQELQTGHDEQLATRERLVPVVRSLQVRGWVDFLLAPIYGGVSFGFLLYEIVGQLV